MKDEEYQDEIERFDSQGELVSVLETIRGGEAPDWADDKGKAFEYLVVRSFQLDGPHDGGAGSTVDVKWPYDVRLQLPNIEPGELKETVYPPEQIDGVIYTGRFDCLIESKAEADNVNFEPVAKLRNQLQRRPAGTIGCVFSSSGFTAPAKLLSMYMAPQVILLWEGQELRKVLGEDDLSMLEALRQKYEFCVENGLSYYDITVEEFPE